MDALVQGSWILSPDETLDIQQWRPEYRSLAPEPFCSSIPPCPQHAETIHEWRILHAIDLEHNEGEAATASFRWYVLHRVDKFLRRIQNHAAAQCLPGRRAPASREDVWPCQFAKRSKFAGRVHSVFVAASVQVSGRLCSGCHGRRQAAPLSFVGVGEAAYCLPYGHRRPGQAATAFCAGMGGHDSSHEAPSQEPLSSSS